MWAWLRRRGRSMSPSALKIHELIQEKEGVIRADERERIAQVLDAAAELFVGTDLDDGRSAIYRHAARLARQENQAAAYRDAADDKGDDDD